MMKTVSNAQIINLPKICDPRGNLTVVEGLKEIPFTVARAFWTYDVPGGESRGGHAHKELWEFIVALSGSFTVKLDDGIEKREITLKYPYQGLLLGPTIWRSLEDFSSGAVALVLCSHRYDPDDYIYDYDEFIEFRKTLKQTDDE
ncbi:MAG: sugar 3,4-ketoisomerase [Muribaculaceae bacterium]